MRRITEMNRQPNMTLGFIYLDDSILSIPLVQTL